MAEEYLIWTWRSPKLGSFATHIYADGRIGQVRRHPDDEEASSQEWGRVHPKKALAAIDRAKPLLTADAAVSAAPEEEESFVLELAGMSGKRMATVKQLAKRGDLADLRKTVRALRQEAGGGPFAWKSLGGRLLILLTFLMACFAYWIVADWRAGDRMQSLAERIEGTVVERAGTNGYDKNKYLTVKFTPASGAERTEKIADYLSAENWEAGSVGSSVRLWHDAGENRTYLEADMLRWQRDKRWIWLLPTGIAVPVMLIILFARQYRIGVHDDGQEYLIDGDRVISDDKSAWINRTGYNLAKAIGFLLK